MKTVRFAYSLFATILKASVALRGAFLLQSAFMLVNNLMFFTTWWVLFARYPTIRGYELKDMMALFAVSAGGFGLAIVLCGGGLELARAISDGELDAYLAQPKNVLLRAVASRSDASGWGDLLSSVVLLWLSGYDQPWAAVAAVLLAAIGFVAAGALLHSAAFWVGRMDSIARSLIDFVILFTTYPPTLFGFWVKVVLFTVLPAGIVAHLPVEIVRNPSWQTLSLALCATTALAGVAGLLFRHGLRRYESGSRFGVIS